MANVSHLEAVVISRRERRAGFPGRRYTGKREAERKVMVAGEGGEGEGAGSAELDNAILVAMKRGLYIFFRDLKASSGH